MPAAASGEKENSRGRRIGYRLDVGTVPIHNLYLYVCTSISGGFETRVHSILSTAKEIELGKYDGFVIIRNWSSIYTAAIVDCRGK